MNAFNKHTGIPMYLSIYLIYVRVKKDFVSELKFWAKKKGTTFFNKSFKEMNKYIAKTLEKKKYISCEERYLRNTLYVII